MQEPNPVGYTATQYSSKGVRTVDAPSTVTRKQFRQPPSNQRPSIAGATRYNAWDIIETEVVGNYTVYAPIAIFSRENVNQQVEINNSTFTISAGDWIVAVMQGPIATFISNPTITIERVTTWSGFPSAYKFGASPNYAWEFSRIPVLKIEASGDQLLATKLVNNCPTLTFTLAAVPGASRTRVVPTFL